MILGNVKVLFLLLLLLAPAAAKHVKGYVRRDGTVVRGYERGASRISKNSQTARAVPDPGESRHPKSYCASCARTETGKIARSATARQQFKNRHPCPATGKSTGPCPGYVIDHSKPLACGGADSADNMGWQTIAAARAKDKLERLGCK